MADSISQAPSTLKQPSRATNSEFLKPTSPSRLTRPQLPKSNLREEYQGFEESGRPGKRPRLEGPQMTAAAAAADTSRNFPRSPVSEGTSPNPGHQALSALKGAAQHAMSKAGAPPENATANPATTLSTAMATVTQNAEPLQNNETGTTTAAAETQAQTSPVSVSSIGTLESMAVPSGLTTTMGSPLPIEETAKTISNTAANTTNNSDDGPKSFSYPPPLLSPHLNDGRRGMSLPHSNTRQGTKSPSSKKHRCPYCGTEFTRHHNLKSHLLTHSQEKPYLCSTCQSRFRRLHDLKRHTKLHTGEKPHKCHKCGRDFARGDALARHNKGPGGCAGRRASLGSFDGNDDFEPDDSMDGVMYNEPEAMEDEEGNERRPGIRRQAPSGDDTVDDQESYSRIPSTYPPIQGRPTGGIASGVYPPRQGYQASGPMGTQGPPASATPAAAAYPQQPGSTPGPRHGPGSQVFGPNLMTESPKPLSPGQSHHRNSTSISSSLGHQTSPSMGSFPPQQSQQGSYPRPTSGSMSGSSLGIPPTAPPQLPPPTSLNPPESRYTLQSQGTPAHPPTAPTGPPTHMGSGPLSSHSNSHSSHGHGGSHGGSGEGGTLMFAKDERLWAVIHNLEKRVNGMQDEINGLRSELASTQAQLRQARGS